MPEDVTLSAKSDTGKGGEGRGLPLRLVDKKLILQGKAVVLYPALGPGAARFGGGHGAAPRGHRRGVSDISERKAERGG